MASDAKRAANRRYLEKKKAYTLRMPPELWDELQAAAEATGQSVQRYILQAMRERMGRERMGNEK